MPFVPFLRPVSPLGRVSFAFQFSTYSLKSSSGSQVTPYPIVENYSCLLPSQLCLRDTDRKMPCASYISSVLCTHSKSMRLFCRIAMLKELGASRLANLALPLLSLTVYWASAFFLLNERLPVAISCDCFEKQMRVCYIPEIEQNSSCNIRPRTMPMSVNSFTPKPETE